MKCAEVFTVVLSLAEHGKKKVSCPKCKSKKVKQELTHFMTKTSRKS